jgi:hypothetical protein
LDPDTWFFWFNLTIAIHAHSAARTVAHFLGADHRTGHPGALQDTLPAHSTIKDDPLSHSFKFDEEPFNASSGEEPTMEGTQEKVRRLESHFE